GQGVEHPAVPHRDAVVDRDRVELAGHGAGRAQGVGDDLPHLAQVHVTGHELGEAVGYRHDRLTKILAGDAGGAQQRSGARHVASVRDGTGSQRRHVPSRLSSAAGSGSLQRTGAAVPAGGLAAPRPGTVRRGEKVRGAGNTIYRGCMGMLILIVLAAIALFLIVSAVISALHFLFWIAVLALIAVVGFRLVGGARRWARR